MIKTFMLYKTNQYNKIYEIAQSQNCTKGQFSMKILLHKGTKLQEDTIDPRVIFAQEWKKKLKDKLIKKKKTKKKLTEGKLNKK